MGTAESCIALQKKPSTKPQIAPAYDAAGQLLKPVTAGALPPSDQKHSASSATFTSAPAPTAATAPLQPKEHAIRAQCVVAVSIRPDSQPTAPTASEASSQMSDAESKATASPAQAQASPRDARLSLYVFENGCLVYPQVMAVPATAGSATLSPVAPVVSCLRGMRKLWDELGLSFVSTARVPRATTENSAARAPSAATVLRMRSALALALPSAKQMEELVVFIHLQSGAPVELSPQITIERENAKPSSQSAVKTASAAASSSDSMQDSKPHSSSIAQPSDVVFALTEHESKAISEW